MVFAMWRAVILVGILVSARSTIAGKEFRGQLKGEILVLDTWSIDSQSNRPLFPGEDYVKTCADHCRRLPGCNGYSMCMGDKTKGCGNGCRQHVAANPTSQDMGKGLIDASLPVTRFGPFVRFSGSGGCQAAGSDAWSYGMCTLMKVNNPEAPEMKSQGDGWVSGTFPVASQCGGDLSVVACEGCLSSTNKEACLSCARSARGKQRPLAVMLAREPSQELGCAVCYAPGSYARGDLMPGTCQQCVLNQESCSRCVVDTNGRRPGDISSCIACVQESGSHMEAMCSKCMELSGQDKVNTCGECVKRVKDNICGGPQSKPGCVSMDSAKLLCSACATSRGSERCIECAGRSPLSRDCEACARLGSKQEEDQCYDCAAKASAKNSDCAGCIMYSPLKDECLRCTSDPGVRAKDQCFHCTRWFTGDSGRRSACVDCLKRQMGSYDSCYSAS